MNKRTTSLFSTAVILVIVGVTATVAYPAYRDYTARSRTQQCFDRQKVLRQGISETYLGVGSMPEPSDVMLVAATETCAAGSYQKAGEHEARVVVHINAEKVGTAKGQDFEAVFTGYGCLKDGQVDAIEWVCHYEGVPDGGEAGRYLPPACRQPFQPKRKSDCPAF